MDWSKPVEMSQVDLAFPANAIGNFLPPEEDIPEEFIKNRYENKWAKQAEKWFFHGFDPSKSTVELNEGVDGQKAFKQLHACLGSFQPKHEHKISGVAYLMSLFFKELDLVEQKKKNA